MLPSSIPVALLANSPITQLTRIFFDDTFTGIHRLSWFDWALLIPYFSILAILSVYGLHRYDVIRTYFKHRKKAVTAPPARFEQLPALRQPPAQGVEAPAELPGRLVLRPPLQVAKHQGGAVAVRQLAQLVVQGGNPVPPGASPNGGVLTPVGNLGITPSSPAIGRRASDVGLRGCFGRLLASSDAQRPKVEGRAVGWRHKPPIGRRRQDDRPGRCRELRRG